jgi:hypothetical protein
LKLFIIFFTHIESIQEICPSKLTLQHHSRAFVGVVSQPSTFSALELGYIYTPQGQCLPVQGSIL